MLHERIRRARALKGMTLQEVADQIGGISKQAISKYEKGKDAPNSTRLIQLADVLGVKPEYFFRADSVELGEVDFRKHSAFGKRQQEVVKERVREHLERYFAAERLFESESVHSFSQWYEHFPVNDPRDVEKAANKLRESWSLGDNPIRNLTETLEENGVKVVGLEDSHEKFDGLCAVVNQGTDAVIVSNQDRPGERQRFNLAHELGHLVMKMPESIHGDNEEERWCHRFAGAFLFPEKQVFDAFGYHRKRFYEAEFLLVKHEWGISMQAALRRLYDLEIVGQNVYQNIFKQWSVKGYRRNEPQPLLPERSYRLKQLVFRSLAEGVITPSRAAELLNTSMEQIDRVMQNQPDDGGQDAFSNTGL
ncbi:helix-turn-helix domain protein [gamma proteobacterium HTCC5015]|nr:helix-turn-helix domain protein [gamma proteobacterium HTCC5015]